MQRAGRDQTTTTLDVPDSASGVERLCLIVIDGDNYATHPLPASGTITIGRAESCDIFIDRSWISRQHVRLHLGAPLRIEDLASSNGTTVRGDKLASGRTVELAPGDPIELGRSTLFVHRLSTLSPKRMPDRLIGNAPVGVVWDDRAGPGVPSVLCDPVMKSLYQMVDRFAAGTINVLLLGETGVGKEVVAEALHRRSPRRSRPFLRLHCGELSESILESELFGHERGAFTGAINAKPGLLATADGGTVFLDEVGELPPSIQVKLLRVIEERQVRRVGDIKAQAIDVRFVSATNRDLDADVASGRFRQDLHFRLDGATLRIPPLRERPSEIEPLANAIMARVSKALQRPTVPALSDEAVAQLQRYSWPGNIRELRNVMERAVLLCTDDVITLAHLSLPVKKPEGKTAESSTDEFARERQRVADALESCAGNQTRAAHMLGISRGTLLVWLDRYGLARPRRK